MRIAYSFLKDMHESRDAAQEAFIKAYQKLSEFKSDSKFFTWFYRILVNVCHDFLRKKKVRGFVSFWSKSEEGEEQNWAETVVATWSDASDELSNKELQQAILLAMDKLPFQQRSVFTLRYLEGLPIEDVAESLRLSAGAVKAHLWQACQKMQKLLKDYRFGGEV